MGYILIWIALGRFLCGRFCKFVGLDWVCNCVNTLTFFEEVFLDGGIIKALG
jgi:hypothetical protein